MSVASNNRRIARNTLMLYFRMAFTMGLGFFMTRELLAALGEVDYGLVNVIGGVVAMFAFLSGTMQTSAARFFNFELGRQEFGKLKQTFALTQLIYGGLILAILLLSETVGLWFLENKLVIPPERQEAAFWFFQFALVAFLFNVAAIPYSALIVAREDMKTFAWISIGEAIGKLGIVYLLYLGDSDRFSIYGALLGGVALLTFLAYGLVCLRKYPESRFAFYWERGRFIELVSFSGWNLFGAASGLFTNVFINILLNNYFGPAVAAARSVAMQVSAGVGQFTQNFMVAVNPQIVKYYAAGELEHMHALAMRASRLGYFLCFFFALPAIIEMDFILGVWLKEVPGHTVLFARLALIQVLIDTLSYPLMTLAQASGKIALYQSVVGAMLWLTLPIVWVVFHLGGIPEAAGMVAVTISVICLAMRLFLILHSVRLPINAFLRRTLLPVLLTSILVLFFPLAVSLSSLEKGWLHFSVIGMISVVSASLVIFGIGLTDEERFFFVKKIRNRVKI